MKKGIVYYSDNYPDATMLKICQDNLLRCIGDNFDVVSVTHKPIDFGRNFVMGLNRSKLSIMRQILKGLKESTVDMVFLVEHDVIYHPSHFEFEINDDKTFYYNRNRWAIDPDENSDTYGLGVKYPNHVLGLLCADIGLMIEYFTKRVKFNEEFGDHHPAVGFSPHKGLPRGKWVGVRGYWESEYPCLDIRHNQTFTRKRMTKSKFSKRQVKPQWEERYDFPYWGKITPWEKFLTKLGEL